MQSMDVAKVFKAQDLSLAVKNLLPRGLPPKERYQILKSSKKFFKRPSEGSTSQP